MKKQYIILYVIYTFCAMYLPAQDLPRIEPLHEYVQLSGINRDLTNDQFTDVVLLASGSNFPAQDKEKFDSLVNGIVGEISQTGSEYQKGEDILIRLHDSVLIRYIEDQTKVNEVLSTGAFNCVSSAIIYMAAGRLAGLNIQGVKTPDHAFVSVEINDNIVDVETTNEWGFDPGQKKEFTDSFSGSTGYNYVPPGNYNLRKNISDKQMIGLILQNRIAALQRTNNHRETVPLAVDRFALTRSEEAQEDMYDTFSNFASQLNGSGQYERGIEFLKNAILRWNTADNVTKAFEALVHNRILSMNENGESEEAEIYLADLESLGIMSEQAIRSDRSMIYDRRTVDLLNSGTSHQEVQDYLNKVYEEDFISRDKWIDYSLHNYIKEAEIKSVEAGWLETYLFVKAAPEDFKDRRKYTQLLNSCRDNYIITVHNHFADLYNNRNYEEAKSIILEGLEEIPENRTLTSDLELIRKIEQQ